MEGAGGEDSLERQHKTLCRLILLTGRERITAEEMHCQRPPILCVGVSGEPRVRPPPASRPLALGLPDSVPATEWWHPVPISEEIKAICHRKGSCFVPADH